MATAGRILIMPKGTWNAETTYENLDMVAHGGRAWLAKKASVGIEPSDANAEFWHDFLGMDVFTEENPPTAAQVGAVDLKRLSSILTTSIQETALTLDNGLHVFQLGGSSYTGNDLPDTMYTYSTVEVFVRNRGASVQIRIWGYAGKPTITCYYAADGWKDWTTEFIPLDYKPSGFYTGNGSATQRTINTGGIGACVMIYGNGCSGIVYPNGGHFVKGTTSKSFGSGNVSCGNGSLNLNTDDEMLNANGKTYGWQVL